jgi:hypothetical protein
VKSGASAQGSAAPTSSKKGKAKAKAGKQSSSNDDDGDKGDGESSEDDEDDEYEVEAIVDMKADKAGRCTFLVKWVGFEEPTWEPEKNLPSSLVDAFRQMQSSMNTNAKTTGAAENTNSKTAGAVEKTQQATPAPAPAILCAKCNEGPEGVGRTCDRCNKPMHHFCATDICVSLNITDENGEKLHEFPNDACFCSSACYNNRGRSVRATATKRMLVEQHDSDSSEWEDNVETKKPRVSPVTTVPKPSPSSSAAAPKLVVLISPTVAQTTQPRSRKPKPKPKPKSTSGVVDSHPPSPIPDQGADRDPLVGKMVAFCAEQEDWMQDKLYKAVKSFFISGRVFRPKRTVGERVPEDVYELRWSHTDFQTAKHVHRLKRAVIERGVHNYATVSGGVLNTASWRSLCKVSENEAWSLDKSLDDHEILDGSNRLLETHQMLPENLEQVEQLKSLDFQASRHMNEPPDLYTMEDGSAETRLHKKYEERFATASSSFFAYLPLSFWKRVVFESNAYAGESKSTAITLEELMQWLGIMFYMALVDKGEYSNYWGDQVESQIFGVSGIGLESVMTLKRFKFIRKNLCFRHELTAQDLKRSSCSHSPADQHAQAHKSIVRGTG